MAKRTTKKSGNRRIWDAHYKTPQDWIGPYKKGSHLSAVKSPYLTIELVTEMWGPAGIAWGWRHIQLTPTGSHVFLTGELYYPDTDPEGEVREGRIAIISSWPIGPDAGKSALTDAITKGLSYLGVHADLYKGERTHLVDGSGKPEADKVKHKPEKTKRQINAEKKRAAQIKVDEISDAILQASSSPEADILFSKIRVRVIEGKRSDELNEEQFAYLMLMLLAYQASPEFGPKLAEYAPVITKGQYNRLADLYEATKTFDRTESTDVGDSKDESGIPY